MIVRSSALSERRIELILLIDCSMPAAKLPTYFLEPGSCELSRDIHGDLARKDVGTAMATHRGFRVAHLAHVEVLAHLAADRPDRCRHRQWVRDHSCRMRAIFASLPERIGRCGFPDDASQPDERRQLVLITLLLRTLVSRL